MLLSVVIPFYQVEHYMGACLDALAGLPEEDCEILLIDDCGRDASAAIAADYSAAHPNARVIRRAQNGGLSAARNTGLDAAQGEYVYFLDSDDVPRADALWHLTQAAKEKRLDVAKARFRFLDDDTGELTDGPMILPTDVRGAMSKWNLRTDGLAVRLSARLFDGKPFAHGRRAAV